MTSTTAEDNRVRLHYLIAGFFEGAYRNGVLDGIIRAAIMAGLALLGYYVKFDDEKNAIFSAGMWIDILTVVIVAIAAVASAVLLVRNKDIINSVVKLFFDKYRWYYSNSNRISENLKRLGFSSTLFR